MARILLFLLILTALQCRERYDVPYVMPDTGYLVVEGFITGAGESRVVLSRTTKLPEKRLVPEPNAIVVVEGEDNTSFILPQTDSGVYKANDLGLNRTAKYRLVIHTADGKQYSSGYRGLLQAPEIESVTWQKTDAGIAINVNSDPAEDDSHFYRWHYEETWEFHSKFLSKLLLLKNPNRIVYYDSVNMTFNKSIYQCWKHRSLQRILIASTEKLSNNVIAEVPLTFIPRDAWEISVMYSILVMQYPLSREGFQFYETLKKNTESLGSIFDAQPSVMAGNIACVSHPSDVVIGFVEMCTKVPEKRIFISNNEAGRWDFVDQCPSQAEIYPADPELLGSTMFMLPIIPTKLGRDNVILEVSAADPHCVDCTTRGTNVKPAFWP